eukprot:scaffold2.g7191.t1
MTTQHENLLPELLLALAGHDGDAFALDGAGGMALAQDVDWVSPPEREQLEGLARLGAHARELAAFVAAAAAPEPDGAAPSAYRLALAAGVSELLDVYRSALLQLEQHLAQAAARSAAPPLLTLRHFLAEFETLLPAAAALAGHVAARRLRGRRVLEAVGAAARSGSPSLGACMRRLLWHCHQALFRQLEAWLVHGLLPDAAADEFFIQRAGSGGAGTDSTSGAAASAAGSPSLSPLLLGGSAAAAAGGVEWELLKWHAGYEVALSALPPEVPLATAEAVLFVGKAVRVLMQPMSAAASQQALAAHAEILGFAAPLRALQRAEAFSGPALERCVEGMRARVAGLLWDLVRVRCDLLAQFGGMKAYYLLGRGDFYQQLLEEARSLLALPPKPQTAEADVALAFQQAALKSTADADPQFAAFGLRWADARSGDAGTLPPWHPARCVDVVLCQYGALWQYCFRLRRVQAALDETWVTLQALQHLKQEGRELGAAAAEAAVPAAEHGEDDGGPAGAALLAGRRLPPSLAAQLWQLRQRMAHFVGNLQLYVQMDVVDASFAGLRSAIEAARDFNEADTLHRSYVGSLVSQAFLDVRQLAGLLQDLFALCLRLAALVRELSAGGAGAQGAAAASAAGAAPAPAPAATLRQLSRDFGVKLELLFKLLQSNKLQSGQRAPALRQLVARLDFCDRQLSFLRR